MTLRLVARAAVLSSLFAFVAGPSAQTPSPAGAKAPVHAKQVKRLLITGAMVIPGPGVPASGPTDILVEDGRIARLGSAKDGKWPEPDMVIDAAGKYLMPGIVNTHMHWHEERVGPMPIQYERNLYLAAGVTTAREVGGAFEKTKQWRAESAAHTIIAPRIVHDPMLPNLALSSPNGRGTRVQCTGRPSTSPGQGRSPNLRRRGPRSADAASNVPAAVSDD